MSALSNSLPCTIQATIFLPLKDLKGKPIVSQQVMTIQTLFSETIANFKSQIVLSLNHSYKIEFSEENIKSVNLVKQQGFAPLRTLADCQSESREIELLVFVGL